MKVLIADDNEVTRQLYCLMLSNFNCQIFEASNGKEAVQLAVSEKPEIILLDQNMPEMTGSEVIEKIRSLPDLRHIAILYITGENLNPAIENKVMDIQLFPKPFTVDELVAAVERATKRILAPKKN